MNEHSHLKNLVNLGFIVDEDIKDKIENLNEEEFYKLIEKLKNDNVFIVNDSNLKSFTSEDIKILRSFVKKERYNVQDFTRNLNDRYSLIQSILIKKLEMPNMVSIDKIGEGSLSIIGFVKEREEKIDNIIVSLEDPTGEIKAIIPKKIGEKLALDDVVALSGIVKDKTLNVDKILFPDVPFKPVVYTLGSIRVAFLPEKNVNTDYIIQKDKIIDNIKNKIIEISNPCIFKINDVIILIALDFDPLEFLKKRYINIDNNDFLIEPCPDIVLTNKDINSNYKGISIISKNKIIDLKTREVQRI
ncbi:hypothetical protein A3K64_01340 [Candidatus Micrarchaeota archaeon RBG_16_36_9]|nr:MAG: hypothetical protein A3K64_01340 [Candidatus Micrarchaeota archaeon RBG_16_36_9]